MIDYIVKYQNNYVSSYLFLKNFPILLEKGIKLQPLLDSQVFNKTFDYDEWPSTHHNDATYIRPYNDSIFTIRHNYAKVFPEKEFRPAEVLDAEEGGPVYDSSKVYKIQYSVNLLPILGEHILAETDARSGKKKLTFCNTDINFMGLCTESEELDIFETETIKKLIEFKWETYARRHHVIGCCMHFFYLLTLIIYINVVYVLNVGDDQDKHLYSYLLGLGIIYPALYDFTQMLRTGFDYFLDFWNYADMIYIWSSIANIVLQNVYSPFDLTCKILMIIIILLALVKTFFFLRIFSQLSPIVTMLTNVVYDLR